MVHRIAVESSLMTSLLTHPSTALKCRLCKKGRYAPPVHMIKLNTWVHPDDNEDFGLIASAVGAYSN
jgi:hypothetical protein